MSPPSSGVVEEFDLRDPVAERMVISGALYGQTEPLLALPVAAFTVYDLQVVGAVIRNMVVRGIPVNPPAVMRVVISEASGRNTSERMGRVVTDCSTGLPPAGAAPYYAERLQRLHDARVVAFALETARRGVARAAFHDVEEDIGAAFVAAQDTIGAAIKTFSGGVVDTPMSLNQLLNSDEEEYDWLIPGLLERTDRVIITGMEGLGKSVVCAQIGCCAAGGIHPFSKDPVWDGDPLRVLIFDCENSKHQLRRRYRWIARLVDDLRARHGFEPVDWREFVRFVIRPEGVDLSAPKELSRIEQAVSTVAPDLVLAGPLYKMSKLNILEEQAAQELTSILDGLRARHHFALVCEGHAGHAKTGEGSRGVRPIGASLFLRWPEFGWGIRADEEHRGEEHPSVVDVISWRGGRDERDWPTGLQHGHELPWSPTADYWDRLAKPTGRP